MNRINQYEFYELIVLAALADCFGPDEHYLSVDQVLLRGLAPTQVYGRQWVAHLLSRGMLESKVIGSVSVGRGVGHSQLIRLPAEPGDGREGFKHGTLKKIKTVLASDFEFTLYLKEFALEIAACECIEYVEYYSQRSKLIVIDVAHDNAQLKLLLLECKQAQVFMLLWRAIKFFERERAGGNRELKFNALIENAFAWYVKYKKSDINIESYDRPRYMKTSLLAARLQTLSAG